MMGNHFLLNRSAGWAAVCISKNACTSLKKAVLDDEGIACSGKDGIHNTIGYSTVSPYLCHVADGKPAGLYTFAVWRDPVERFTSIYRHFALDGYPGRLASLPADVDAWINATEDELKKPVDEQDEHLRRQSGYYGRNDVDAIVGLDDLAAWFEQRGWGQLPHENGRRCSNPQFSPAQIERIRGIYADDIRLLAPTVRMLEGPPLVQGLWIGSSLPPLAQLTIRSYLDHGFCFRLATYGKVAAIPQGTEVIDAGAIIPPKEIFTHSTGSLAPFSDWFRYRLLADHGGIWSDMDNVCLRPFRLANEPWYSLADTKTVNIGLLSFPAVHAVTTRLAALAEDPATLVPWDGIEERNKKGELRKQLTSARERRSFVRWGDVGPWEFTRALRHYGIFHLAVPAHAAYPIPWNCWRHAYDGTRKLEEPEFRNSITFHLWGEMLRNEPDAMENLASNSIVATLMRRHGLKRNTTVTVRDRQPAPVVRTEILVGVCSCSQHTQRRQACRETWFSQSVEGVHAVFFVGNGNGLLANEPDTYAVPAPDTYEHLPEKVLSFFRAALQSYEFNWLFKCDDDTYLALDRLRDLSTDGHDLLGNEFLTTRNAPSGGAGYLLSRAMVEKLVADASIPPCGDEDILIGRAALRHGARALATSRFCWDTSRYPKRDNDVITSHWCTPSRMRVIHANLFEEAKIVVARHAFWKDQLKLFSGGLFIRTDTNCAGTWHMESNEEIRLSWFDWNEEKLVPDDSSHVSGHTPSYRCLPL